jgi:hypothetical protein
MNINWDKLYKGFTAVVLGIVLILSALGYYQGQLPPDVATDPAVERGGFSTKVHFEQGGAQLTVESGGAIVSAGAITSTGSASFSSLSLGGVAQSGPTVGVSATVSNGTRVAHGLGVTPTVEVCTPWGLGLITATVYISASNATSITIGLAGPGEVNGVVYGGSIVVNCIGQR